MSDREIVEGMKAFAEWHKDYTKKSIEAVTWKIPVDCIPKKEPIVELTVEEAKVIQKLIRHCYFLTNKPEVEELAVKHDWILKTRIEQAEKCYE